MEKYKYMALYVNQLMKPGRRGYIGLDVQLCMCEGVAVFLCVHFSLKVNQHKEPVPNFGSITETFYKPSLTHEAVTYCTVYCTPHPPHLQ